MNGDRLFRPRRSHGEPTVFRPENLLESERRRRSLALCRVPRACLLDIDGDLDRHLRRSGRIVDDSHWPCFHSRLGLWTTAFGDVGIVAGTVGAPFAVLVAEELFASGCEALVSLGSAGKIAEGPAPPFFMVIERALRDEGTSGHYLPSAEYVDAMPEFIDSVMTRMKDVKATVLSGATWTTDAPFRETASAIAACREQGVVTVEMEAAALLAFARAAGRIVACLSHVTNEFATGEADFDKGGRDGLEQTAAVCEAALSAVADLARATGARSGAYGSRSR